MREQARLLSALARRLFPSVVVGLVVLLGGALRSAVDFDGLPGVVELGHVDVWVLRILAFLHLCLCFQTQASLAPFCMLLFNNYSNNFRSL